MNPTELKRLNPAQARDQFIALGAEAARRYAGSNRKTMVIMTPDDADFFGKGFLDNLNPPAAQFKVLWFNTYSITSGDEVSIEVHRFSSSEDPVDHAVILSSQGSCLSELRSMVLTAMNHVPLSCIEVICPWMCDDTWEQLKYELPDEFSKRTHEGIRCFPGASVRAISTSELFNLPGERLRYIPACVMERLKA